MTSPEAEKGEGGCSVVEPVSETEKSSTDAEGEGGGSNSVGTANKLDLRGASVHYLRHHFMREVFAAGLNETSKIYEIENLDGPPGIIRSKGIEITSSFDNRVGASYVDCLEGEDNVGHATHMLSYGWGYSIGDIVNTLEAHCAASHLNPKRTYIWICCLCINQHRVVEQQESQLSGMTLPEVDFLTEFRERVTGIGRVLAVMAPWDDPLYLKRVWCIFELFTGYTNGCDVTILMPPKERKRMSRAVLADDDAKGIEGVDSLYEALARTRVEGAQASVEEDRVKILDLVKKETGYTTLNRHVNVLLRDWVWGTLREILKYRDSLEPSAYVEVCNKVGNLLRRNGEFDSSLELFRDGLSLVSESPMHGDEHVLAASLYNNIGLAMYGKGEWDNALEQYRKAVSINERNGSNNPNVAASYGNIGEVLLEKHDYGNAMTAYKKAFEIHLEVHGMNHLDTAKSKGNIATVLDAMGDHSGALLAKREALAIEEDLLGEAHPSVATSCNNIGFTLQSKGDFIEALEQHRKALNIRISLLGKDHFDTATSHHNVGTVLYYQGEYDAALVELGEALRIRESKLGGEHPLTIGTKTSMDITQKARDHPNAEALTQKGEELFRLGKYDEAEVTYREVVSIKESVLGNEHPEVGVAYRRIGDVLEKKGNYEKAVAEYRKALAVCESTLGTRHVSVSKTYNNMAIALKGKGELDGALTAYQKALAIEITVCGDEHEETATTHHNLGQLFLAKNKLDQAHYEFSKAASIYESVLGPEHEDTGDSLHQAAYVLFIKGDFENALQSQRQATACFEACLGGVHPKTAVCYNNMGSMLQKLGDLSGAEENFRKSLEIYEAISGPDHTDTAYVCNKLGQLIQLKGDHDGALAEYQRALTIYESSLGKFNSTTLETAANINALLKKRMPGLNGFCTLQMEARVEERQSDGRV